MRYTHTQHYGKKRHKKGRGLGKGLYVEWLRTRLAQATSEAEKANIRQQLRAHLAA